MFGGKCHIFKLELKNKQKIKLHSLNRWTAVINYTNDNSECLCVMYFSLCVRVSDYTFPFISLLLLRKSKSYFSHFVDGQNEARVSEQKYSDRGGNKCLLIPRLLHLAL